MLVHLRASAAILILMIALTGLAYPFVITGAAGLVFPEQARGSLIRKGDVIVGAVIIGQKFTSPRYFHGRPSAAGKGYNAQASSGTNLAPSSKELITAVKGRVRAQASQKYPVDLVTSSGSGLDPHISPAAAQSQVIRVAKARGMEVQQVRALVAKATYARTFGILGEPRVNVLKLNLLLDGDG